MLGVVGLECYVGDGDFIGRFGWWVFGYVVLVLFLCLGVGV